MSWEPVNSPGREPLAYRVEDAAKMLGVGRTTIYSLINNGHLKAIRIGRARLVTAGELRRFIYNTQEQGWKTGPLP